MTLDEAVAYALAANDPVAAAGWGAAGHESGGSAR